MARFAIVEKQVFLIATFACASLYGQLGGGGGNPPLVSLKTVPVPQPTGLAQYVQSSSALVVLGKALFWDVQAGSDGKTACGSCHFHAGADHRMTNILGPPASASTAVAVNQTATAGTFPFHVLSNVANRASAVVRDTRQVAGSPGIFARRFSGVTPGSAAEDGADIVGSAFSVGGLNVRQVGTRNAPSVINAVFNVRNFWDGRASRLFSGQTPFGASDTTLNAVVWQGGQFVRQAVQVNNASLASQAVGPPLNGAEMSYASRSWPLLGRKMLSLSPLAGQTVAADDSVLGPFANAGGSGLAPAYTYVSLIQAAFQPAYWSGTGLVDAQYSQMEANFALFWGLAIQAYEATLVSDNTRVDQFLEGNQQALTAAEQQGLQVFQRGQSQCTQCHQGAEFTAASFTNAANTAAGNAGPDNIGFFRTGVAPLTEDTGLGGNDDFGIPLFPQSPTRANGTFKAPGLRNVEFTGPYFHDGGQATLEQVLQFYARNGDFPAGGNLGPGIGNINLSAADQTALVAFLKALSDDRVRYERAPFDHPSLCVSVGAIATSSGLLMADTSDARFSASAAEKFALVPAVGGGGNTAPLQTFDELLAGIGSDGSRSHTLTQTCDAPAASPAARIGTIANAASFAAGAVSPGEIVTVFGSNLTAGVTFNGTSGAAIYASPVQVNVTVPYTLTGATTTIQVGSSTVQVPVAASAPGIFAAAVVAPGVLTLYATGGGVLGPGTPAQLTLPSTVTVNGEAATVLFAGAAPGLAVGVNQINVQLAAPAPTGPLNIVWSVGGISSKPYVLAQ